MKTTTIRFILGATAVFCLAAGTARGMCAGDENAAGAALERYAWQKQEMLKGTGSLGGTSWAGWGMRKHYDPWLEEFVVTYSAAEANAIAATNPSFFCATPLFWPSPSFMFTNTISAIRQTQILSFGIPVLSPAVGCVPIQGALENIDMNTARWKIDWPRNDDDYKDNWLHSDIKNIAYLHIYNLYNRLVGTGGLR